jgi:hypothetical protein
VRAETGISSAARENKVLPRAVGVGGRPAQAQCGSQAEVCLLVWV